MTIFISSELMAEIQSHGEGAYPEEGAGLLLGVARDDARRVSRLLVFDNAREESARHNRYLLTPQDYLRGELEASRLGLDVLGVFHSHPDHPNRPSEFDRDWAIPQLSYIITSIQNGKAAGSRSWLLSEDHLLFNEESILISDQDSSASPEIHHTNPEDKEKIYGQP